MPEMDGFEATAAIRRMESASGKHTPIVAMTAHAMKGDRERCLAAGMDGYISKPIQFDELLEVTESLSDSSPASATAPTNQSWDVETALARVGGDQVLLADLAKIFCDQSPRLMAAIDAAVDQKSLVNLKRAAHSLRSAIATFAAQEASETAATLEQFSRPEEVESCREIHEKLASQVEELRGDLEKFARSAAAPADVKTPVASH